MPSENREGCVSCGRSTRVGTRLFSDRHTAIDNKGTTLRLCGECHENAIAHDARPPTERRADEVATGSAIVGFMAAGASMGGGVAGGGGCGG
jgi:hypothetical protein